MEDFIERLRETMPKADEKKHIDSLSPSEMINELIYAKGGFVYRAYLIKKLLGIPDHQLEEMKIKLDVETRTE